MNKFTEAACAALEVFGGWQSGIGVLTPLPPKNFGGPCLGAYSGSCEPPLRAARHDIEGSDRGVLLSEDTTGDYDFLDFRGALVDLGDLGVPHQPFHMILLYIAIPAVDLHGLYCSVHGYL